MLIVNSHGRTWIKKIKKPALDRTGFKMIRPLRNVSNFLGYQKPARLPHRGSREDRARRQIDNMFIF